ncbi:sugar phosphate isomerase/epimerase family protein [Zongyangia sp. HA2173]|uniref:TIM barrel protein n=1 Tax=Zongyangia sp. HA2173 TaxID=3133035 RepID=UPI001749568C
MNRPITLATGQWGDLPLEELCELTGSLGFDGLEIAVSESVLSIEKAASSKEYCEERLEILHSHGLKMWAICAALAGQCVGDLYDPRLDNFAPARFAGKPEEIRKWAIDFMMQVPTACNNLGVSIVTGFLGSPIWKFFYSFPQTTEEMIEEGYDRIVSLWTPILDEFQRKNVKFAFEVHPTEIAFDYYSTQRLLKKMNGHPAFGLNFDPSHLIWQGVNPTVFLQDFAPYVFHVHMKDASVSYDGRRGILGSHLPFGSTKRAWNFRSLGHGDVNFEEIIRELNAMQYTGPLSIEWEDNGMDRIFGLKEAISFVRRINFPPSEIEFDAAIKTD